jgi:hypothetical protein
MHAARREPVPIDFDQVTVAAERRNDVRNDLRGHRQDKRHQKEKRGRPKNTSKI